MKKSNFTALLLGAALFTAMGTTILSAEGMKCGAGKCGASMSMPASKCGGDEKNSTKDAADKRSTSKCGTGKCGSDKKIPKKMIKNEDEQQCT